MIQRNIYKKIKDHLQAKEITVIIGPRQIGKTTLMNLLKIELEAAGESTLFFNLDYEADSTYFQTQQNFLAKLELELGKGKGYVFIDEIQRKENAGLFLKGLYDRGLPYKFIISGSGSLELKEKIQESLAGRKRLFEVLPVSFEEFLHYKTEYAYTAKLKEYLEIEVEGLKLFLDEYLNFGGYPRIITEAKLGEKRLIMDEIFRSYVERDIVYLLNIDRPDAFTNLVKILSSQAGQMINYTKISAQLNIALQTVKKYIWYLQKTFIIRSAMPFFRNFKKEITKSPFIYFNDLGMRNYALGVFGNEKISAHLGFLFQNFIFNLLYEMIIQQGGNLHFWRTTDKAEVDVVIDRAGQVLPVEIKFMNLKQKTVKRSLRSFIDKYSPENAWIINLNLQATDKIGKTRVHFIPYYLLLTASLSDTIFT